MNDYEFMSAMEIFDYYESIELAYQDGWNFIGGCWRKLKASPEPDLDV